jgi:nitroreductase
MNETLKSIYGRASVRKYKADKVPEDDIREILKAGFHAANGLNRQAIEFAVVENKDLIRSYNRKGIILFAEMMRAMGRPFPMAEKMVDDPSADIFYGAPAVIFVFARPDALTPVEDGSLAAGNMMLAAHSMGYGTCFIGFAAALGNDKEFRKECNVPEDRIYVACLILGKPDGTIERRPRPEVKIHKWVK